MNVCVCVCARAYVYVCAYGCVCMYVYVCMCVCVYFINYCFTLYNIKIYILHLYIKSDFKHAIGYRFLTGIWNIKI